MESYPFAGGGLAVSVHTADAHDKARETHFPCEFWYPAAAEARDAEALPGRYPLVVYSHHAGGHRCAASYLCTHLASHGYVVAALDHSEVAAPALAMPPEHTPEQRAAWAKEVWAPARVADVRFLIDHALTAAPIEIDADRIGIVGHSFGGWTALATPDTELRIASVVALAPAGSEPTPPGIIPATLCFAWGCDIPTLYLVAEQDASLPLAGCTNGTVAVAVKAAGDFTGRPRSAAEDHGLRRRPARGVLDRPVRGRRVLPDRRWRWRGPGDEHAAHSRGPR